MTKEASNGNLDVKPSNTLLGDSYLPVLRSFQTTQRAPAIPKSTQIAEFQKTEIAEAQKPHVPKLINPRERININKPGSLFDRQRNILIHA